MGRLRLLAMLLAVGWAKEASAQVILTLSSF